jgi:hypothetical protein
MNIKGITEITKTVGGFATKHSPTILTGIGVAGVISTIISAHNDTIKALAILDDELLERNPTSKVQPTIDKITDEFTKKEIVKLTWKCYVPTAILATITMGCIVGGNSINLRRNAALAGAYSLAETALKEYKNKVVETMGKNKDKEIKEEIIKDKLRENPYYKTEVIRTGRGDTLCYDSYSGRYFWSDMNDIKAAINNLNMRMRNENWATLNDFYSEIDIEGIKAGDLLGWHVNYGTVELDYDTHLSDDGRPCLVVDFDTEPKYWKMDF